jgi:hypothetical protein
MTHLTTAFWALLLGLLGFVTVELVSRASGAMTAMTSSLAVDAGVFAAATLLALGVFWRPFARGGWRSILAIVGFVIAFAPLAGALAAVAELTLLGEWGAPGAVGRAFRAIPLNLIYALAVDLPLAAFPAGLFVAVLLSTRVRRTAGRRRAAFGRRFR